MFFSEKIVVSLPHSAKSTCQPLQTILSSKRIKQKMMNVYNKCCSTAHID